MKKSLYILILLPFIFIQEVTACTIFTAVKGKTVLFASNEDQPPNKSYLVVDPTGKYGVVFFATPTAELPLVMQMGINEKGLSYDINSIAYEKLNAEPNTIKQTEWALVALMREVGSVNELLDKFFTYDWGNSIAYQIHLADRFGDAAVIHPGQDGKLTYTRLDKNKGYLISTNFNLGDLGFINKFFSSRYRAADNELKKLSAEGQLTPEFMTSILEKTHQEAGWINPTKSIYSAVVNLNTLDIYFYYDSKFDKPYLLNVRSELSKAAEKKIIPIPEVIASIPKN
jgi:hypothetical protein